MTTNIFQLPAVTWRSYFRALAQIVRNDWRRYWRYPLSAASSVFQPIIWLVPVYFMGKLFSVDGQAAGFAAYSGTADYMSYILVGNALGKFVTAVFWGMGYSLKADMDAGVLESNWLAPLPRPLLLIGRTITSMFITAITSTVMLLAAGRLFGFDITGDVLPALLSVVPMLVGLYGFGFAFAALVLVMKDANTMVDVSNFLVEMLSGANFPVKVLPGWLLPVALAIPLTYGFDMVRGWLLGTDTILPIPVEMVLMVVFMVLMVVIGLWVLKVLERRVRIKGTLGQH